MGASAPIVCPVVPNPPLLVLGGLPRAYSA